MYSWDLAWVFTGYVLDVECCCGGGVHGNVSFWQVLKGWALLLELQHSWHVHAFQPSGLNIPPEPSSLNPPCGSQRRKVRKLVLAEGLAPSRTVLLERAMTRGAKDQST